MWALVIVAAFLCLAWVGRQSRLGRLAPGPWIRQFRAVRSVLGMLLLGAGGFLAVGGEWPAAIACLIGAFVLGGSVRISGMKAREPQAAASYTADEIRAYQTLGLSIGADRAAVKAAWKRLMKEAHPDQGGNAGRAAALNAARDVLLRRR
jgi:uncharacterized membrane protein